jgi:YggT family protein
VASLISVIGTILYIALLIYFFLLWGRFILDLARVLRPQWRPSGVALFLAEASYSVTDPPIKFFRRVLPRVAIGPVALDFGWTLTMLCCIIAMTLVNVWLR